MRFLLSKQAKRQLFRRRDELALVVLFVLLASLVGFWLGRITAPDSYLAYERGRVDGRNQERRVHDQTRTELDILRNEVEAAKVTDGRDQTSNRTINAKRPKPDKATGVGTE